MPGRERSDNVARKLKAAGKWQEFVDFRIGVEGKGLSKTVSYNRAISEFHKYLVAPDPDNPDNDKDETLPDFVCMEKDDFKGKPEISYLQALNWALDNVGYRDLIKGDAPSPRAWSLVRQFRQDQGFYKDCQRDSIKKLMSKAEQDGERIDDGRKQFTLLDKLLSEQGKDSSSGMVPDNDAVLQSAVSGPN